MNYTIKISHAQLCWGALALYWIMENIAPHSIFSKSTMLIMVALLGMRCVTRKRIELCPVFYAYCGVILLQGLFLLCGFCHSPSITAGELQTMVLSIIVVVMIYTFLVMEDSYEKVEQFFLITSFISLAVVLYLSRDTILMGRMGHAYGQDSLSYVFLGKNIALSSNTIATYSCIGFFFALSKYNRVREKKLLVAMAIFILGVVLTGSRKGILMLCAFFAVGMVMQNKGKILLKLVITCLGIGVLLYLIFNMPALYEVIGQRLEALLINFFTGQSVQEGSLTARARYARFAQIEIRDNWGVGNGLGWFKSYYGNVTENNYYELLVGCGIGGMLINYSFVPTAIRKILRVRKNAICLSVGMVLIVLLVMQWGSVVYYLRNILMYESLFFLICKLYEKKQSQGES